MNEMRCAWCGQDPLYVAYHDEEWGVPVHDDRKLFEMLILEGVQAGLSWITVLRKRDNYRKAFEAFDAVRVARFDSRRIDSLMKDAGIVRNRLKIEAAVHNARAVLRIIDAHGSLDAYLWRFVGGKPLQNAPASPAQIPSATAESTAMSRELKRMGCNFVGPTICYAFMQAVGMVNDHVTGCYRYEAIRSMAAGD